MGLQTEKCHEPCAAEMHRVRAVVLFVGEHRVGYELFESDGTMPQFFVEVSIGKELFRAPLGEDFVYAARVYDTLVRGEVTPCTAGDIVADLRGDRTAFE